MSTTQLQAVGNTITCFPGINCFQTCNKLINYTPTSSTLASFGPARSSLNGCSCNQFTIVGATTSSRVATGSSAGGNPFQLVTMTGNNGLNSLEVAWTVLVSSNTSQTCNQRYYLAAGPAILGTSYGDEYFALWWAILIAAIVFFCICFGICFFCGLVGKLRGTKQRGKTLSPPAPAATTQQPNTTYAPGQYAIPMATSSPYQATAIPAGQNYAIPQAIEVNDKQMATV